MKICKLLMFTGFLIFISSVGYSQYKDFGLSPEGDTLNITDKKNLKQKRWVIHVDALRGEPGYEEEGVFINDQKDGYWRRYNLDGDLIAVEHYKLGGKDGLQQYYSFLGELQREESWRGYNPDSPYDTIAVYGSGSNEIVDFKVVKAEPYSVKQGTWKYYDNGQIVKTEEWERNNLVVPKAQVASSTPAKPKKVEKTEEMLKWELKNKGKKGVLRDGQTGL